MAIEEVTVQMIFESLLTDSGAINNNLFINKLSDFTVSVEIISYHH